MYDLYLFEYSLPAAPLDGPFSMRAFLTATVSWTYTTNSKNSRNSFIALLLPHFFPVSPLLHHSYKKMGGGSGSAVSDVPTSSLELPTSRPRPYPSPHNLFVPMHLQTKLHSRKNPPLSKPFRISILQDFERLRPYPPLSKSFRINSVTNLPQKAPLSKSFGLNRLQTARKAPLSKSFRITLFPKYYIFSRPDRSERTRCASLFQRKHMASRRGGWGNRLSTNRRPWPPSDTINARSAN